jgi:hypothetical protein
MFELVLHFPLDQLTKICNNVFEMLTLCLVELGFPRR